MAVLRIADDVIVESGAIGFEGVDCPFEIQRDQTGMQAIYGIATDLLGGTFPEMRLHPEEDFKFSSRIKLTSPQGQESDFQIGFVQTVTLQQRHALYEGSGHKWQETLAALPIRDGSAPPFYQDPLTFTTRDRPTFGQTITRTLSAWDCPSFSFPRELADTRRDGAVFPASLAYHRLEFLVALMVRYKEGEVGAADFFLSTFRWHLTSLYRAGDPPRLTAGYVAYAPQEVPAGQQEDVPAGLVLDGPAANDRDSSAWALIAV